MRRLARAAVVIEHAKTWSCPTGTRVGRHVVCRTTCQACGATGQSCCQGGVQCTGGGCCDSGGSTSTCVAKGATCTGEGTDEVCGESGGQPCGISGFLAEIGTGATPCESGCCGSRCQDVCVRRRVVLGRDVGLLGDDVPGMRARYRGSPAASASTVPAAAAATPVADEHVSPRAPRAARPERCAAGGLLRAAARTAAVLLGRYLHRQQHRLHDDRLDQERVHDVAELCHAVRLQRREPLTSGTCAWRYLPRQSSASAGRRASVQAASSTRW